MTCENARKISIVAFLSSLNINPVKIYRSEYLYCSPYRDDKSPSFSVNIEKNQWWDSGRQQGGDLILLIRIMYNVDIAGALKIIDQNKPSFSFSVQPTSKEITNETNIEIRHIKAIQNKALISYLNQRKIPLTIATRYLVEVYYQLSSSPIKKQYFALGFKNDHGGYELRNKYSKIATSPKTYTTIKGDTSAINIFEGFFSFLSSLVYFKTEKLKSTVIVLNSLSFVNRTLPIIEDVKTVNLFIDNDQSGEIAKGIYKQNHKSVKDISKLIYPEYKDFNDFLTSKSHEKTKN